jgi:hypothetical protein
VDLEIEIAPEALTSAGSGDEHLAHDLLRQHEALSGPARQAMGRAAAKAPHVDRALVEALASRETNMRNIVGDGGHGRGMFQADDRYQEAWLRS